MSGINHCPACGCKLPPDFPAGVCPDCLLSRGLPADGGDDPFAATTPQSGGFKAPGVAEIARYFPQLEILELIGQGGMGAVYKARQTKLDRLVALKVIKPESAADPAFAERFNREARTLARLNHPQIVGVHDFGEVDLDGRNQDHSGPRRTLYYFVMEYVDGTNVRALMDRDGVSPQEALSIVGQVCNALQYAHDEGVVHRDIKPENILIDVHGRVKIADFGLAKLAAGAAHDFTLTGTHQVMGTPRYMAPEQMAGSRAVDHRADIYSLGVVFYELLTGEAPAGHFDPPSQRARVDARLDAVVLRALASEPDRRFQAASEFKSSVDALSGEVSVAGASHPTAAASRGASTILDREVLGAWRWIADAETNRAAEMPSLVFILLCLVGCGSILLPWITLMVTDAKVTNAVDSQHLSIDGSGSAYVRTYAGLDNWPGLVAAGAMALLGVVVAATPRASGLSVRRALLMTALAAGAAWHVLLFKMDLASGTFRAPGLSPMNYSDIAHTFALRNGIYVAFAAALGLLLLSGLGLRHAAVAAAAADPAAETRRRHVKRMTPLAHVRFSAPEGPDLGARIVFHFSGLGYELAEESPDEWVFQRGVPSAGMWATDIRQLYTILTVRTVRVGDRRLVNCDWAVRTYGSWITRGDTRRLEGEARDLERLLNPNTSPSHDAAAPPEPSSSTVQVAAVSRTPVAKGASHGGAKYSRKAIFGACWAAAYFVVTPIVLVPTTVLQQQREAEARAQAEVNLQRIQADLAAAAVAREQMESHAPGDEPPDEPPHAAADSASARSVEPSTAVDILIWPVVLVGCCMLPIAVAPFGTTILGFIAISDIRRSQGRIVGLGLAFADAALFPSLFLYGLLAGAIVAVVGSPGMTSDPFERDLVASLVIAGVIWVVCTPFVLRRFWRSVSANAP